MTSSAVVLLVRVIPLAQFGCWIPVLDITGIDCSIGRGVGRGVGRGCC